MCPHMRCRPMIYLAPVSVWPWINKVNPNETKRIAKQRSTPHQARPVRLPRTILYESPLESSDHSSLSLSWFVRRASHDDLTFKILNRSENIRLEASNISRANKSQESGTVGRALEWKEISPNGTHMVAWESIPFEERQDFSSWFQIREEKKESEKDHKIKRLVTFAYHGFLRWYHRFFGYAYPKATHASNGLFLSISLSQFLWGASASSGRNHR